MAEKLSFSSSPANPFSEAFPHSRKVLVEGERVAVPMREIALSGGESPLQVYDTSGPHGVDVRAGLPPLRDPWILGRGEMSPAQPSVLSTSMPPCLLYTSPSPRD